MMKAVWIALVPPSPAPPLEEPPLLDELLLLEEPPLLDEPPLLEELPLPDELLPLLDELPPPDELLPLEEPAPLELPPASRWCRSRSRAAGGVSSPDAGGSADEQATGGRHANASTAHVAALLMDWLIEAILRVVGSAARIRVAAYKVQGRSRFHRVGRTAKEATHFVQIHSPAIRACSAGPS
jgi:hypothetical protein